jgi:beta-lactam-binding protein with PASTA domain
MSVDQARSRLQAAGFSVNVSGQRVRSLGVPKGRVAYSSPGGGGSGYSGQTVTLFISSGPPPIPQPDPEPTQPPPNCDKKPDKPGCPPPPGLDPSD